MAKNQTQETAETEEKKEKKGQKPKNPQVLKPADVKEDIKYIIRLGGSDLDGRKRVRTALAKINGVGDSMAHAICEILQIPESKKRLGELSDAEISQIDDLLKNPGKFGIPLFMYNRRKDLVTGEDRHLVGSDLDYANKMGIDAMQKVRMYRGIRHYYGLKLRGQRTGSRGGAMRGRSGKTVGVQRKGKAAPAAAAAPEAKGAEKPKEKPKKEEKK